MATSIPSSSSVPFPIGFDRKNTLGNVINVIGYIPGVSIISSLPRIITSIYLIVISGGPSRDPVATLFGVAHIVRGVIELSGAGILFIIPDIVFTVLSKSNS